MRSWPLFDLVLRTPRLELRPVRDVDLDDLVDAACSGIHDDDVHPFPFPWNVGTPDEVRRRVTQFQWRQRAELTPTSWTLQLGVHVDGRVVGVQDLAASDLAVRGVVDTGSWLRRDVHGRGVGTEMRAAALLFAFDHLGARVALSGYSDGNAPSAGVSRRLGYVPNGRVPVAYGERSLEEQRVRLDRDAFVRPEWTLVVDGWDAARADLLGDDA